MKKTLISRLLIISQKVLKWGFISAGLIFVLLCVIAFTTIPYHIYHRLATYSLPGKLPPTAIVMLSGAGIPSESGLIRAYYTAALYSKHPEAWVIIAAPGDTSKAESDPQKIARELILRGVDENKILFETQGKNTRGQAMNLAVKQGGAFKSSYLILVSSPEHMTRAIKTFNRAGFSWVSGLPAFENSLSGDLSFDDKALKGNRFAPPIGENMQFRYQFWNHLKYEIIIIREYFALLVYKIKGWI